MFGITTLLPLFNSLVYIGKKRELTSIGMSHIKQSYAGVKISKRSDAKAVGGMELSLQEVTANLPNIHQLQQAGSGEQHLVTAEFIKEYIK